MSKHQHKSAPDDNERDKALVLQYSNLFDAFKTIFKPSKTDLKEREREKTRRKRGEKKRKEKESLAQTLWSQVHYWFS